MKYFHKAGESLDDALHLLWIIDPQAILRGRRATCGESPVSAAHRTLGPAGCELRPAE